MLHQEALLMLLLPSGRWKKNTITLKWGKDPHGWKKTHTVGRNFNANLICPPSPLQPSPLKPYQYFERRESIYMILYFPTLSSAGNPRASPKETNAPASISQLLILLTRRRSPTHSFAQGAHTVRVCVHGLYVCALHELWLYTDTWCAGG